jgi:hypothetical protein
MQRVGGLHPGKDELLVFERVGHEKPQLERNPEKCEAVFARLRDKQRIQSALPTRRRGNVL